MGAPASMKELRRSAGESDQLESCLLKPPQRYSRRHRANEAGFARYAGKSERMRGPCDHGDMRHIKKKAGNKNGGTFIAGTGAQMGGEEASLHPSNTPLHRKILWAAYRRVGWVEGLRWGWIVPTNRAWHMAP